MPPRSAPGAARSSRAKTRPKKGRSIHATGPWGLAALSNALGRPVGQGVKGQAATFHCPGFETAPQLYADGLHIVPHADGTIAIGSTSEREWTDPAATDAQLDALILRARAALPLLADCPATERWAGLRPRAKTRQPLLGPWPDRSGHFIANGGFKIGFGIAPQVARLVTDLVLEGKDAIPEAFRP